MTNPKVSDMNKEYVINFLQEYSHYIKEWKNRPYINKEVIKCPTEFFETEYLHILEETEKTEDAFKDINKKMVQKAEEAGILINEDFELFYERSWIPDDDSIGATQDNVNLILKCLREIKQ